MAIKDILVSAINNPKLLVGFGIAGFIGAGVFACVQTLKLEGIIEDTNEKIDDIIENHSEEELKEPEVKKELAIVRAKMVGKIAANYAGPVIIAGMAAWAICRAYGLQKQAYLAMSAAYSAVAKAYDAVLERVEKKWGPQGLKYAKYGIEEQEVGEAEYIDEKGKTKKEKIKGDVATERFEDMKKSSPLMIIFDEDTNVYRNNGGDPDRMVAELLRGQNGFNTIYHAGIPVMYNGDIVREFCGNDPVFYKDAGQILGGWKDDPVCREAINDCIDLGIGTFIGTDPDTGEAKRYVYIDPKLAVVNFDANKKLWPQGQLQMDRKKRVGGKYISQIA